MIYKRKRQLFSITNQKIDNQDYLQAKSCTLLYIILQSHLYVIYQECFPKIKCANIEHTEQH